MRNDTPNNPQPQEIYRHFKGDLYQIITLAKHCESGETLVIYQALYGNYRIFARPLSSFTEKISRLKYPEARQAYRFVRIRNIAEIPLAHPSENAAALLPKAEAEGAPDLVPIPAAAAEILPRAEAEGTRPVLVADEAGNAEIIPAVNEAESTKIIPAVNKAESTTQISITEAIPPNIAVGQPAAHPTGKSSETRGNIYNNPVKSELYAAEQEKNEPSASEPEDAAAEDIPGIDPQVMKFLGADTSEERLRLLSGLHPRITDGMINTMAAALDLEIVEGPLEGRYEELRHCLLTMRKFERR